MGGEANGMAEVEKRRQHLIGAWEKFRAENNFPTRESLIAFLRWVGDGHDFDKPGVSERIVDEYIDEIIND